MRRPVGFRKLARGQQFAGQTIQGIVKTVLRRNQHRFALLAIDPEIGQHDIHRCVVVPAIFRDRLVVPYVLASLSIDSNNR